MARVEVTIPSMLARIVSGERLFAVEAADLDGVLEAIFLRHPELRVHVLDEQGALRRHVTLFHNDVAVRDRRSTVADGDRVAVLQAVSGG